MKSTLKVFKTLTITTLISLSFFKTNCFASIKVNHFDSVKETYNFTNIGVNDGLSQNTVGTIFQDTKGYIWIGTNDGLDRYNGHQFKHYKHDKYNNNTISNNYIVDIIEDNKEQLWVATSNGLNRININTNETKRYHSEPNEGNLSNNNLWEILFTSNNKLLVASIDGVNLYDKNTDSFTQVFNNNELPSQFVYSLTEDKNENIWVGTDKGLVKFDKNLNKIKDYSKEVKFSEVYRIKSDNDDNIWVCTSDNGLFKISKDNTIKQYTSNNSSESIPSNSVRDILIDSKNNIWVCTSNGISKFNLSDEKFHTYKSMPYDFNSLRNNESFCFLEDTNGLIWIGTSSGVSRFNPKSNFNYFKTDPLSENALSSNMIHGIYENNNVLWVGTNKDGLNVIDRNTNTVYQLTAENSYLTNNEIKDITGYDDKVFIGTNNGLNVVSTSSTDYYSPLTETYTTNNGLPSNKIRALFVDNKNYLWIGTNKGLAVLNPKTKKITNLSYVLEKAGVPNAFVKSIFQDSKGEYYIGCFLEGGLIRINPKTNSSTLYKNNKQDENSISSNSIRDINEDNLGKILIATNYGFNILDKESNKFTHYNENDGLSNNTVYGILIDDENNLWMSTNFGISKFNQKNKTFENFTVDDGLQSNEFIEKSSFKNSKGMFLFGGINGFNAFRPSDIKSSNFIPTITFDNIEIGGVESPTPINKKLGYEDNNIKISYFSNDYKNSKSTQYYYKLEGLNDDWQLTDNNSILFSNLKPGNYTFKIKARNSSGIMSKEESICFIINPPIWKSKTAIAIYLFIILLVIYLNISKVKRLDRLVDNRTKELQLQMNENKTLYEKVLTLEKNKNNYFVNLSHELRTPLNVLNSISQLLKGLSKKEESITPEKLNHYTDIMERNCNRLLNLINNLIDNSKLHNNNYILTKKTEDIVYIVEETVLSMKDFIESKDIELIIDTDVEEKNILCDKIEIERCIVNLVGNAVKFTNPGGSIEVFIYDLNDKIKISIKDTGVGISEENQKYIFDRFNQVVDENSEIKGGSGLGLTIVKQLIELHGGSISVKSELGIGSEFIIILPQN